jgi:hypothetical protein
MISLAPTVTGEDVYLGDLSFTEEQAQELTNAMRTAGQGMSFSTGDEIEAVIRSVIGDKSYSENIDAIRSGIKGFEDENPSASQALFWAGVLPTMTVAAPKIAMMLLSRFNPMAQASILGVAGGGLEGFAAGEGVEDRIANALATGVLGGILGPTIVGGAVLAQKAAPKVKGFLTSLKEKVSRLELSVDPNTLGSLGGNVSLKVKPELPEPQNLGEADAKRVVEITGNARREGREELTDAEFTEVSRIYVGIGNRGEFSKDFVNYIRNNSDLPMDKASRNQRMMEQGFEGPYYKGRRANYVIGDTPRYSDRLIGAYQHMSEDPVLASSYGGDFQTIEELAVRPSAGDIPVIEAEGANWNQIPLDTKIRFTREKEPLYEAENIEQALFSGSPLNDSGTTTDEILRAVETDNAMARAMGASVDDDVIFENIVDRGSTPQSRQIIEAEKVLGNPDPMAYKGSINRAVIDAPERIRRTSANFDPLLKNIKNLNAAMAAGIPLGALGFFADNEEYYQDM